MPAASQWARSRRSRRSRRGAMPDVVGMTTPSAPPGLGLELCLRTTISSEIASLPRKVFIALRFRCGSRSCLSSASPLLMLLTSEKRRSRNSLTTASGGAEERRTCGRISRPTNTGETIIAHFRDVARPHLAKAVQFCVVQVPASWHRPAAVERGTCYNKARLVAVSSTGATGFDVEPESIGCRSSGADSLNGANTQLPTHTRNPWPWLLNAAMLSLVLSVGF